jgi:hypothetical protein
MSTTIFEFRRTIHPLRRRVIQHCARTRFITFVVCSEMRLFRDVRPKCMPKISPSQRPIASNEFEHFHHARRRCHPPLSEPHTGTNFDESDCNPSTTTNTLDLWRMKPLTHKKTRLSSCYSLSTRLTRLGRHPDTEWNPRTVLHTCSNNLTGLSWHKRFDLL